MFKKSVPIIVSFLLLSAVGGNTLGDVATVASVTAASQHSSGLHPAVNTINGSGMTGDYHDMDYANMWLTNPGGGGAENPNPGTEPGTTWIKYKFDKLYTLTSLWVWNYNGDPAGDVTSRGLKNVTIEYTSNGTSWVKLGDYVFNKATHEASYAHNTTVFFNGAVASAVVVTAKGGVGAGNWGAADALYGLSEVRFYGTVYTNPYASDPNPPDSAVNVTSTKVLSWRRGAYAADVNGHDVYLGTDYNSVAGANHLSAEFKSRQTATSYDPCGLAFGLTYYWRIDEVNDPCLWPGGVWSFTVRIPAEVPSEIKLNRGIVLDRQFRQIPPEYIMTILPADIQIIKSMGFEFVKLLVNPALMISGSTINTSNIWYLDEIVNRVLDEGLPVVVCIHPEPDFKTNYLGNWTEFQNLLGFYEDFAAYMAARWEPNELAFQLMTEPYGNLWDWNIMLPLMWQAVRNGMPNHILILSGDQVGQISGLIQVEPVNDENVYYCFTIYDPFIFTMQGSYWNDSYWTYLGDVPYPSSPSIVEAAMPTILANIPDAYKGTVQSQVTTYGYQYWNKSKQQATFQPVVNWNNSHGGQLKVWCAEFGVLDPVEGGGYGGGCIAEDRYEFLRDRREAMEEDGIGWAYWSYNETFTVLDPNVRVSFSKTPSYNWVDEEMLHALGILCGEGDINCDDTVDYEDLVILANQWLECPDFPPYADIVPVPGGDDVVNFPDFAVVCEHWLANVTPY